MHPHVDGELHHEPVAKIEAELEVFESHLADMATELHKHKHEHGGKTSMVPRKPTGHTPRGMPPDMPPGHTPRRRTHAAAAKLARSPTHAAAASGLVGTLSRRSLTRRRRLSPLAAACLVSLRRRPFCYHARLSAWWPTPPWQVPVQMLTPRAFVSFSPRRHKGSTSRAPSAAPHVLGPVPPPPVGEDDSERGGAVVDSHPAPPPVDDVLGAAFKAPPLALPAAKKKQLAPEMDPRNWSWRPGTKSGTPRKKAPGAMPPMKLKTVGEGASETAAPKVPRLSINPEAAKMKAAPAAMPPGREKSV